MTPSSAATYTHSHNTVEVSLTPAAVDGQVSCDPVSMHTVDLIRLCTGGHRGDQADVMNYVTEKLSQLMILCVAICVCVCVFVLRHHMTSCTGTRVMGSVRVMLSRVT